MGSPGLTFGPFVYDPDRRLLKRDGAELPLPPRVLGVLDVLVRRAGDIVPRQELIDTVWKDAFVTDTSLGEAVSVLRQTLGDDPQAPSYIQTLHRRGYRFLAPVAPEPPAGVSAIPVTPSIGGQLVPWSIAAICAIVAAVAVWTAVSDSDAVVPVTRFAISPAAGTWFDRRAPAVALSPDASRIAWSACDASGCRLYLRAADRLDAVAVGGTDDAAAPFFSPDSRSIGFFAGGHLKKVSVAGGAALTLADAADPFGAVWTRDGRIVYAGARDGLRLIRETGGTPSELTTPRAADGEIRHLWPSLHPTADLLFFTIATIPGVAGGGRLAVVKLDAPGARWTALMSGVDMASPVAPDALVFSSGPDLQALAFDTRRTAIAGAPQTAVNDIARSRGAGQFAASPAGALITVTAAPSQEGPSLSWLPPAGHGTNGSSARRVEMPAGRDLQSLSLSPDGRRAAGVDRADASRSDIWIGDLERGAASRLTHERTSAAPIWSPDGASVFFASSDGGAFAIYARDADGLRPARRIHQSDGHAIPSSVSPDGSLVAFISRDTRTAADVWGVPSAGGTARPLVQTPFEDVNAAFSPAGRLIAYQSNDAGRWEVYVQREPDGRRLTISTEGGTQPFWSADGRALYFQSRGRLMKSTVAPDGSSASTPELVTALNDAVPIGADKAHRVLLHRRPGLPGDTAIVALQWAREARLLLGPPSAAMPR
jgi:DNA-binding winged helix-turn-helix (wHTH) protein/Tol biopolymer transport system component